MTGPIAAGSVIGVGSQHSVLQAVAAGSLVLAVTIVGAIVVDRRRARRAQEL